MYEAGSLCAVMAQKKAGVETSIVQYFYEKQLSGHKCGYCGSKDSSMTNGMWAYRTSGQDYQDLIERGWRRSGKYMYKPVMNKTCCPLYAIRCEAPRFEPSKSQRKVANKMKSFLLHGKVNKASNEDGAKLSSCGKQGEGNEVKCNTEVKRGKTPEEVTESASFKGNADSIKPTGLEPSVPDTSTNNHQSVSVAKGKQRAPRPGDGPDPSKPPSRKTKEIRLERKQKKLAEQKKMEAQLHAKAVVAEGQDQLHVKAGVTEDHFQPGHPDQASELSAKMEIDEYSKIKSPFSNHKKKVNEKKTVEMLLQLPSDQPMTHRLETKIVACNPVSTEFIATFPESFALFKKYQIAVHGDKEEDVIESSYRRFLCDTPLITVDGPMGWKEKYGSFHVQYYLNGKLFMVAVIDILPTYLSSVYVFYDPDYRWLELGVYSALYEIQMVRKLHLSKSEFQFYCMGYYVHNNQKMNYKGKYYPSFLLCPDSYQFIPIEIATQKLDISKYSRFSSQPVEPERVLSFLGGVLILFERQVIPYMLFRGYYGNVMDRIVVEYASLVGKPVSQRMFLCLEMKKHETEDSDH